MGSTPIGLSASRGAAVAGLNPYQSRFDIWLVMMEQLDPGFCEKNNYPKPEHFDSAATNRGNAFEAGIIEWCEKKAGYAIHAREKLFTHTEPWGDMTCHTDGIYDNFDGGTIHEAKTVNSGYFRTYHWAKPSEELPSGRFPKYYEVQVQHQQICTGINDTILTALVTPFDDETTIIPDDPVKRSVWVNTLAEMGFMYQFHRDGKPAARAALLEIYREFMTINIDKRIPPEPMTESDYKWIHWNFGEIEATKEIVNACAERKSLKKEMKEAKSRVDDLTDRIKRFMAKNHADAFKHDTESNGMVILKDGKKIASYTKDKNGNWSFR